MKSTIKRTAQFELEVADVNKIISEYLQRTEGVAVKSIKRDSNGKVFVVGDLDESTPKQTRGLEEGKGANAGYSRRWTGFYESIGMIFDQLRKKKKNFISYNDLYEELLDLEDDNGKKLFIRDKKPIEKDRFRQYISKSQIQRQALNQANLRNVKVGRKNDADGLHIG
jgi:hypothetical protein